MKTTECLAQEIHVWRAFLDHPPVSLAILHKFLSQDEHQRSQQYLFERDARRFLARRGLLRIILGQYCQQAPEELQFHCNEYGKPFLSCLPEAFSVNFSVSHSDGVAFYAIAFGRQVGVDIEYLRPLQQMETIVQQYFSPLEQGEFFQAAAAAKPETFFSLWTRKEAYIKAKGRGLSYPLQTFAVTRPLNGPHTWMTVADQTDPGTEWGIIDLSTSTGFKAALAAEGKDWNHRWQEF